MKMTMEQITAAHPDVAKLESQAGRELLAAVMDMMQALAAENVGLKNAISCHAAGFTVCEACGEENISGNDDVCRALNETPATDAFLAEVRAQGVEMMAAEAEQLMDDFGDDSHKVMVTADLQRFACAFAKQLREVDQ